MLSDIKIKSLKARGKDLVIADGGGLYVRCSITGKKTFMYRTRVGGKARYATLGEYPRLSLADARRRVSELQGEGIGDYTVSYAVSEYLKACPYLHPEQVRERLERDIVPEIGSKRLSLVTAADITNALQKIVDRGSPVAANRTLADVKHVFQFAYGKGWIQNDVSARITRRVVGGREKTRSVVLSDSQLQELCRVMMTDRFELRTRVAVGLLLLTGQRASEVLGIQKSEISGRWWTIPAERTKAKRQQKVYLSYPVRRLLKFCGYSLGGDHRTLSRALLRMNVGYTPHDLRRCLASKCPAPPHVIEKMLNHQMVGVMVVYNHNEFLSERRVAWIKWSRYVLRLIKADREKVSATPPPQ